VTLSFCEGLTIVASSNFEVDAFLACGVVTVFASYCSIFKLRDRFDVPFLSG
jgi:hypothetical protein